MGHGGESIVGSPQNHHSSNHHPHVGGSNSKKAHSVTKSNGTPGGGISHNHDNSKSSKASRKSHAHSVQQHSKPINMCNNKSRQSSGAHHISHGNKANLVALQQFQHPQAQYNLMKQQQSRHVMNHAVTPRQKSYSPPTLHPMPSGDAKPRTQSPVTPGSNKTKEHFYAGARFETHPSHIGLPVPPSHWTDQSKRSQSQPSSPVPTSLPQKGISVDLATLFGNSDSALKSASFPGERLMDALMRMEDERKRKHNDQVLAAEKENNNNNNNNKNGSSPGQCTGSPAQAQLRSNDETDELKKALGLVSFSTATPVKAAMKVTADYGFSPQRSDFSSPSKYQDISNQLKTLLKVAA